MSKDIQFDKKKQVGRHFISSNDLFFVRERVFKWWKILILKVKYLSWISLHLLIKWKMNHINKASGQLNFTATSSGINWIGWDKSIEDDITILYFVWTFI